MEDSGDYINRPRTPEDQDCSERTSSQTQVNANTLSLSSQSVQTTPIRTGPGEILPPHHGTKKPVVRKPILENKARQSQLNWNVMQGSHDNANYAEDEIDVFGPSPRYLFTCRIATYINLQLRICL